MMKNSMTLIQLTVAIALLCMLECSADARNEEQAKSSKTINGKYVLGMGRKYDKPLLRLLGKAINNVEKEIKCVSEGCDRWSDWSICSVRNDGEFGMQVRTRQCYLDVVTCEELATNTTERDYKICEGSCGEMYNKTKNGFCLKYVSTATTKPGTIANCQADGGHVVNVNSPEKMEDVKSLMKHQSGSTMHWIDGQRTSAQAPWTFSYQTHLTWSPKWESGDPDNGVNDLCLRLTNKEEKYDGPCTDVHPFICEIA